MNEMKICILRGWCNNLFQWCSHPVTNLQCYTGFLEKESLQCYGIMAYFFKATLDNVPQMHFLNTEVLEFRVGIIRRIVLVTTLDYVCNDHFNNLKCPWNLESLLSPLISNSSKNPAALPFRIINLIFFLCACLCCVS